MLSCAEVDAAKNGAKASVAGVVLTRQRPGKGNAIFISIEDETGIVNAVLWASYLDRLRRPLMASRMMVIEGTIQRSRENIVHLMATNIIDRTADLDLLSDVHNADPALLRSDKLANPPHPSSHHHPRDVRILPKSRDFH